MGMESGMHVGTATCLPTRVPARKELLAGIAASHTSTFEMGKIPAHYCCHAQKVLEKKLKMGIRMKKY